MVEHRNLEEHAQKCRTKNCRRACLEMSEKPQHLVN